MNITALIEEAARRLETTSDDIEWYSWPSAFGSTAGPCGGIGGQMLTTFQVFGFAALSTGWMIKNCSSKWKKWDGEFFGNW